MDYFHKVFHLLTGGLEFIEVSAKLKDDITLNELKPHVEKFAKYNDINILFVKTMPKLVIGKTIYIKYNETLHTAMVKALHSYYDGIAINRFFNDLDKLFHGEELDTVFKFKTPIENKYGNMLVELGANVLMNKISDEKYDEDKESEPYLVIKDKTSGDIIREIQKKEGLDMIMLINKRKVDNDSNDTTLKNNLTFRYIKKDEDFKDVLKNSSVIDQGLRFSNWLLKKHKILFLNNLSSLQLPSFIERLICNKEQNPSKDYNILKTLVVYPRGANNTVYVYKG